MVIDAELLKKNCEEFRISHPCAIDVLRQLNGKHKYMEIAKILNLNPSKVSGLQKKAARFGLANKFEGGYYKKIPGVLGFMPKNNKNTQNKKTIPNLIRRVKNKKSQKIMLNQIVLSQAIFSSIDKMASAYKNLFVTENALRELIRKVFENETEWWKNRVPVGIKNEVEDTINKIPYHAAKRKDELEYTHLGQLKEIVICKKNWKDFLPFLYEKDKNTFAVTINRAIPSRNSIGHCIPLNSQDLKVVDVRFQDILKMLR